MADDKEMAPPWVAPAILVALAGGATYLLGLLLWPFLPALVTSAVIATLCHPLHDRVERWIPQRSVAALVTTTALFFLVLVPTIAVGFVVINEVRSGLDLLADLAARARLPSSTLSRWWTTVASHLGLQDTNLGDILTAQIRNFVGLLARRSLRFLSGLGGWLIQGGAAIFTLYYLFRDGHALTHTLRWLVPLDAPTTEALMTEARDVIFATIYGNVAVAVVQGALGGLAFWALGLPAAALWGTVMAILSLLPAVGAFLVWAPAAVILLISGSMLRGLALLAFGIAVISTIDNYLRAVLVGGRSHLHPLVVFFSVLGGLVVFGATGVFIGPVLFVVALSVIEVARLSLGQIRIGRPSADVMKGRPSVLIGGLFGSVASGEQGLAAGEGEPPPTP